MAVLTWDDVGDKVFELGVDHGVLYIPNGSGVYDNGVAWNGLTGITESPSGGEANAHYADNIKYANLYSAEEWAATLECFTYPKEFEPFDGLVSPSPGVTVGQQGRGVFGLSYRTLIGNDVDGQDHGYKLHLAYGLTAAPSEKAYTTINDSPEPLPFSYEVSSLPVPVTGLKPTSILVLDSRTADPDALAAIELILYGDTGVDPALPTPDAVLAILDGTFTEVTPGVPTYNSLTDEITIPGTVGVIYSVDGVDVAAGAFGPITENVIVSARPDVGYVFAAGVDDDWLITFS
jgi:hypothetical protein